jgi:hypothetical protein
MGVHVVTMFGTLLALSLFPTVGAVRLESTPIATK